MPIAARHRAESSLGEANHGSVGFATAVHHRANHDAGAKVRDCPKVQGCGRAGRERRGADYRAAITLHRLTGGVEKAQLDPARIRRQLPSCPIHDAEPRGLTGDDAQHAEVGRAC